MRDARLSIVARRIRVLAVGDVAVLGRVAGRDVGIELILDRLAARVALRPAHLDARVIPVQAQVLLLLESFATVGLAGEVAVLRIDEALDLVDVHGRVGIRRTLLSAGPEGETAQGEIRLRGDPRIAAAQERDDLRLIDAAVDPVGIARMVLTALVLRRAQRVAALEQVLVERRVEDALRASRSAAFHADVVLVPAGVLRDLVGFLAVGLAVEEAELRVADAWVARAGGGRTGE